MFFVFVAIIILAGFVFLGKKEWNGRVPFIAVATLVLTGYSKKAYRRYEFYPYRAS